MGPDLRGWREAGAPSPFSPPTAGLGSDIPPAPNAAPSPIAKPVPSLHTPGPPPPRGPTSGGGLLCRFLDSSLGEILRRCLTTGRAPGSHRPSGDAWIGGPEEPTGTLAQPEPSCSAFGGNTSVPDKKPPSLL